MKIFQKAADWIRSRKTPAWLKYLLESIQDVTVEVLEVLGSDACNWISSEIIRQSKNDSISGREKFQNVFNNFRDTFNVTIRDYYLDLAIQLLYARLKKTYFTEL